MNINHHRMSKMHNKDLYTKLDILLNNGFRHNHYYVIDPWYYLCKGLEDSTKHNLEDRFGWEFYHDFDRVVRVQYDKQI